MAVLFIVIYEMCRKKATPKKYHLKFAADNIPNFVAFIRNQLRLNISCESSAASSGFIQASSNKIKGHVKDSYSFQGLY